MDALKLDGNAAAGLLQEVFAFEVTAATGTCDNCGAIEAIGALVVYSYAPGTVLRCPHCDSVLMRIVTDGTRYWVDLRGVRSLESTST
jgi:Zn finger protein HypA/HybF involved in hydrogenase expression